jgi:hypothetical protein
MTNKIGIIVGGSAAMLVLIAFLQYVYKPFYQIMIASMPNTGPITLPSYLDPNVLSILVAFFGILAILFSILLSMGSNNDDNY